MHKAHAGEYEVTVMQDMNPENPRECYDNLGTMLCWHRRYNLGDHNHYDTPRDFLEDFADDIIQDLKLDPEELSNADIIRLIENAGDRVLIPIYMYDHSGITIKTTPFCDPWDSGQIGWIYVTPETLKSEYKRNIDDEVLANAQYALRAEVGVYDDYLTGNAWGYILRKDGEAYFVDSCWGFFGDVDDVWDEIRDCLPDCFEDSELEEVFE